MKWFGFAPSVVGGHGAVGACDAPSREKQALQNT
jgi:hypothetical protein